MSRGPGKAKINDIKIMCGFKKLSIFEMELKAFIHKRAKMDTVQVRGRNVIQNSETSILLSTSKRWVDVESLEQKYSSNCKLKI